VIAEIEPAKNQHHTRAREGDRPRTRIAAAGCGWPPRLGSAGRVIGMVEIIAWCCSFFLCGCALTTALCVWLTKD